MRKISLIAMFLLTACQHADPSDCSTPDFGSDELPRTITNDERASLEEIRLRTVFSQGWACGFHDGVNSRKLVIDLP